MRPEHPLPYSRAFADPEEYVRSLLDFARSSALLQTLCGGVHILDFFTSKPDLYPSILPQQWRDFISDHENMDLLQLLMREPLESFEVGGQYQSSWRNGLLPPRSMIDYIREVRRLLLVREPYSSQCARNRAMKPTQKLARQVAVGMNLKKVHEVGLFASYIDRLVSSIASSTEKDITHLVDFGSGQNYLGRALASPPYDRHIVAIESKGHNQDRAKEFDAMAKLRAREMTRRNKKAFRAGFEDAAVSSELSEKPPEALDTRENSETSASSTTNANVDFSAKGIGSIQYVEHWIKDGDLSDVLDQIIESPSKSHLETSEDITGFTGAHFDVKSAGRTGNNNVMVMSLHSCGNLVHHGLRSLIMNRSVSAVAMVGCCYNLVTERLSPATYKLPELRPAAHPRLLKEGMACDPHGFPMSDRLCKIGGDGVKLNITARMMAVQAPQNWGEADSDGFFTRHFYRALLQRIFLDKGVVGPPRVDCVGGSPLGHSSGTPLIIGSLRKSCYTSFVHYVRGAVEKLVQDPERGQLFREKLAGVTDEEIEIYEREYGHRKRELSAVWSLMAFSAGVVEALIVVDRWLWLKEQKEVAEAWAEPVFDYAMSPRNLVLVGIKRRSAFASTDEHTHASPREA